jgi:diaminopimelate decarboxylase
VPSPARFARELGPLLEAVPEDRRPTRLAVEPGRALVARAGWLVARVLHVRDRAGRQVVLDAGMTELIRPALYGARHPIHALTSLGGRVAGLAPGAAPIGRDLAPARVEGPICESTDALGTHDLPPLRRGDLVAVADAGAYAASLSSTYNGRPRPPQVLLERDGTLVLGRRRGSLASLG